MIFQDCPVTTELKNLIFKLVFTVKNLFLLWHRGKEIDIITFFGSHKIWICFFCVEKKKQRFLLFMGFVLVETKCKKTANMLLIYVLDLGEQMVVTLLPIFI